METLLDDYKRKLQTAERMLGEVDADERIMTDDCFKRVTTKAAEYRTFIVDIERAAARQKQQTTEPVLNICDVSERFLESLVVENIVKSYGVDLMIVKELAAEIRKF